MKLYQNNIVKTSLFVVVFYLLYLSSQYIRIAPTIIPIITPIALLYIEKKDGIIFSISYMFLLFISGFQIQALFIFSLFLLPVILYRSLKKFILYAIIVLAFSILNYYIIFDFFNELIPQFIMNSFLLKVAGFMAYYIFLLAYPFLLNKVKNEIDNLIERYIGSKRD
jgi:hypothetical protein